MQSVAHGKADSVKEHRAQNRYGKGNLNGVKVGGSLVAGVGVDGPADHGAHQKQIADAFAAQGELRRKGHADDDARKGHDDGENGPPAVPSVQEQRPDDQHHQGNGRDEDGGLRGRGVFDAQGLKDGIDTRLQNAYQQDQLHIFPFVADLHHPQGDEDQKQKGGNGPAQGQQLHHAQMIQCDRRSQVGQPPHEGADGDQRVEKPFLLSDLSFHVRPHTSVSF